ncbi:MAG: ribosome maturation factor RimM [Arachnia propionica]|nr:MAG: ribosome maturation factor RimM [Arachnia propionica]
MTNYIDVVVGSVERAHGIRGDVVVVAHTDEPKRRFAAAAVLTTGAGEKLQVASSRRNGDRWLMSFVGHQDRTAAEALRGQQLVARVAAAETPSGPEEYFDRQLIGLQVRSHDGAVVGVVADVLHRDPQDLLSVEIDGQERLVPFVAQLVPVVDVGAGFLQIADVPGLLEDIE